MIAFGPSEHEIKLQLVHSLVKSQTALARILDSVADVTEQSETVSRQLYENIRILTNYQSAMAGMLTGIRLNRQYYGTPTTPWINEALDCPAYAARGEQEEMEWQSEKSAQPPDGAEDCSSRRRLKFELKSNADTD